MSKRLNAVVWLAVTLLLLTGLYLALKTPLIEPQLPPGGSLSHADHKPKHGGVFFMAADGFHHLEGTLNGRDFRIYLYDNFTKPMDARRFQARVGSSRLQVEPTGQYLTVHLDDITTDPPEVTAFVRFRPDGPENRFDFIFIAPPAASGASGLPAPGQLRDDSSPDVGTREVQ